jgi:hypothetical protein
MRTFALACILGVSSPLFALPLAHAQPVSDADRAAARDLFFEGVKYQNEGKFADGLDRFQRAQRIFSAPTHLLHIAECQVALGQLVEGSETYRTLVRTPLPQGAPAAFTQAQQQGGAELAQVEPRIPSVKIDVNPQNLPNLQVQIDGAPMNNALVGVSRPINPGAHKVVVFAPGYGRQEAQFALKEREPPKTVAVNLQATGGVVYGPAVGGPPPVATAQPVQPVTQPPPNNPGAQPGANPPPNDPNAAGGDQAQQWTTEKRPATASLLAGARVGVMFPAGSVGVLNASGGQSLAMSDVVGTGAAVGLEGGLRFAKHFFGGLGFEHGVYGKGDKATQGFTGDVTTTLSSNLVEARFAYISNADGVGFYGEIGVGYRWLIVTNESGTILNKQTNTQTLKGGEVELGAGAFIKAGNYVRFIPKVSFGVGTFSKADVSCNGSGCSGTDLTLDINTATHTFVFLGVGGYYNYDLNNRR